MAKITANQRANLIAADQTKAQKDWAAAASTIDASNFSEALYRIFAADGTTVLVTASLTGGQIAVAADTDEQGNAINVFRTTLSKASMADTTVPAGQYTHSFKVTNGAGLELPPVFQNTVSIVRAND